MSDLEHACNLLAMAGKDLRAVLGMLDAARFDDEVFGFHAQQAIEKSLKAWCSSLSIDYPLTHNLAMLFDLLKEHGLDVGGYVELAWLTPFAVRFRYEEPEVEAPPLNRPELTRRLQELVQHVANVIESRTPSQ